MQCYFCEFFRNLKSYQSTIRSWTPEPGTPTEPTGPPVHQKNHLDGVRAGFGTTTRREENICYSSINSMSYTYIILPHNLNSTELHLQGVAPRSQYSDHAPEAVMFQ